VVCKCGACREIEPEALARLVGWKVTLKEMAPCFLLALERLSIPPRAQGQQDHRRRTNQWTRVPISV